MTIRPPAPPLSPVDLSLIGRFPVSANQERSLLARQLRDLNSQPTVPSLMHIVLEMRGNFDTTRVRRAFEYLTLRHDALRISFSKDLAIPPPERQELLREYSCNRILRRISHTQTVAVEGEIALDYLQERSTELAIEDRLQAHIEHLAAQPFPLSKPHRVRGRLVQTDNDTYWLIVAIDHLVCDRHSVPTVIKDLRLALLGDPENLIPARPSATFASFAAWQNSALTGRYFERDLDYWRDQWAHYAGARISRSDLHFGLKDKTENGFHRIVYNFAEPEVTTLQRSVQAYSTTLFVLFLTAFASVLHRYTGKTKIAIWSHFANRVRPETWNVVGYFSNMHLIGMDFSAARTGGEALNLVAEAISNAIAHQEVPLDFLWRSLNCIPRVRDDIVLLDLMSIPKRRTPSEPSADFRLAPSQGMSQVRAASLGVYVVDSGQRLALSCEYARARFAKDGVQQLLEDLSRTAMSLAVDPNAQFLGRNGSPQFGASRPDHNRLQEFVLSRSDLITALPKI